MPNDGRSISRNVAHLNILVHDMINLLYYEYWTDKQKYLYVYILFGFLFELFKILGNALTIVILFLSFKRKTKAYLLNISITHDENLITLLYLLIMHTSKISSPNIVFKKIIYFVSFKFSNNWFLKFICKLLIWLRLNITTCRFFIKKLVNHWS